MSPLLPSVFSHASFSAEEADHELFTRFSHDMAQCIEALEFLQAQGNRIAQKYAQDFFRANTGVSKEFELFFGENGLDFGESAQFYAKFDSRHARSAKVLTVHPKERQFSVPSLETEVVEFSKVAVFLESKICNLTSDFSRELDIKIRGILVHLKHIQTRLKQRDGFYEECVKLERKLGKLQKKHSAVASKVNSAESAEIAEISANLARASARYTALNAKLKITLPESMLLVEEFVCVLVNWTLCRHHELVKCISRVLQGFCQTHGFLDPQTNTQIQDPSLLIDEWESKSTPTRLRLESLLVYIQGKNSDYLDSEIPEHKRASGGLTKAWSKLTHKSSLKRHEIRASDRGAGIFNPHHVADPLSSYTKFQDPTVNLAETYHPAKMVTRNLPQNEDQNGNQNGNQNEDHPRNQNGNGNQSPGIPPPLPPRDNVAHGHVFLVPQTPPPSAAGSGAVFSPITPQSLTEKESRTVPTSASSVFSDVAHEKLARMYNSQKNDITSAPVLPSRIPQIVCNDKLLSQVLTDPTQSETRKLLVWHEFYDKVLEKETMPRRVVTATREFSGESIEDLSFHVGEKIEVLFDLQSHAMTYIPKGENWFLGATVGGPQGRRMGFVPSTHFE